MTPPDAHAGLADLLVHADWVRAVARRLVAEASAADDVVQDTWVAALERPPRRGGNLRAWLAQVVRNQARGRGRAAARARAREREAARPEVQPSTDEVAQRAALQRELVGHVLELDEPFRTVVLLRFFEHLSAPEVAEHLGVPLKTVHSRTQRAFERLRTRLDSEYGDARRWCVLLMPLAASRELAPLAALSSGTLIAKATLLTMNTNAKAAVAVTLLVLGGVGLWRSAFRSEAADGPRARAATAQAVVEPVAPAGERDAEASERAAIATPAPEAVSEAEADEPAPALGVLVRGRAVDVRGNGLEGVDVVVAGEDAGSHGRTGADGAFELRLPPRYDSIATLATFQSGIPCLRVDDERWVTLRQSCVEADNLTLEHLVVAAPAVRLEGWVESEDGAPIEGAHVELSALGDAYFDFPYALDTTAAVAPEATSDESGRFVFESFPDSPGLRLFARAEGFAVNGVDLDDAPRPLVIRMARPEDAEGIHLEGVVLDDRGRAVEGAAVRLGEERTETDRAGLFRIRVGYLADATPLCASKRGHQPALVPDFGALVERQGDAPEPVELVLGGPPLSISGRVVDESGAACAGWAVSVVDETAVSQFRIPVDTAESLARDHEREVTTDDDGAFEIRGLFPRGYVLQAFDRATLVRTEAPARAGDEGVILRADRRQRGPLRGVVVSRRGQPLPGVRVAIGLDIVRTSFGSSSISASRTVTDADGAFTIERLPLRDVHLSVGGDTVLPDRFEIPERLDGDPLELLVAERCHFRLELASRAAEAVSARFYDAQDRQLQVSRFEANAMSGMMEARLSDGRSEVLTVSENAVRVVVLDASGAELFGAAVSLAPGDVNVIRL